MQRVMGRRICGLGVNAVRKQFVRQCAAIPLCSAPRLVLYSKPGCHLCDGLKEKVEGLLTKAEFMPSRLTGTQLEVRDITSDPVWERRFAMEIPVLAWEVEGSGEVLIPRAPPRTTGPRLQKIIEEPLEALGIPSS